MLQTLRILRFSLLSCPPCTAPHNGLCNNVGWSILNPKPQLLHTGINVLARFRRRLPTLFKNQFLYRIVACSRSVPTQELWAHSFCSLGHTILPTSEASSFAPSLGNIASGHLRLTSGKLPSNWLFLHLWLCSDHMYFQRSRIAVSNARSTHVTMWRKSVILAQSALLNL